MKTTLKIFTFFLAGATLIACAGEESEQLRQARTIQEAMSKSSQILDSSITVKLNELSTELTTMSADSLLSADSLKMAQYKEVKTWYSSIEMLKSELSDWTNTMKKLPSTEEIANGAENPFGADMKDEDILKAVQADQTKFEDLKSRIETEIQ
jgi:hypothetical protein